MERSFDNVDNKVAEAEFFLAKLIQKDVTFPKINWYLSAFVSAARSITFCLQAVMINIRGFEDWYEIKRIALKRDPLTGYFTELRNYMQKTGATVVNQASTTTLATMLRISKDGAFTFSGNWFGISDEAMPLPPKYSVSDACRSYFVLLLTLVYDCYLEFGQYIDPQQRYTSGGLSALGLTFEDVEEELGLPSGWTDIGKPELSEYRLQLFRRMAGACTINNIFEKYLKKVTPMLEPLPELPFPTGEGWCNIDGTTVWLPKSIRKTGSPKEDLRRYIASLRGQP